MDNEEILEALYVDTNYTLYDRINRCCKIIGADVPSTFCSQDYLWGFLRGIEPRAIDKFKAHYR